MAEPADRPVLPLQIIAERTHLVIPSLPNWIEPTVTFLCQKAVLAGACQESRSRKLLVTLHEAVTNSMIHGNLEVSSELKEQGDNVFAEALAQRAANPAYANRKIDIVIDFDGEVCRWILTDEGPGFDVERVLARCLSDDPEITLTSGRGILMMTSFLDDVRFAMGGRQAILSLARNSGAERRKGARVSTSVPFQVTPIGKDGAPAWSDSYEAVSRNFSEHGVSILQRQIATSGKVLIGVPTENGVVHIPAEVKHSRPLGARGLELGCQFTDAPAPSNPEPTAPLSPLVEEVQHAVLAILDSYRAKEVPSDERRVHPRVVFNERMTIHLKSRADTIIGYARDLSRGGIALIAQEPLPGEVSIEFGATDSRRAFKVRCRVVRCSLIQEGFYDVGMTFMQLDAI